MARSGKPPWLPQLVLPGRDLRGDERREVPVAEGRVLVQRLDVAEGAGDLRPELRTAITILMFSSVSFKLTKIDTNGIRF